MRSARFEHGHLVAGPGWFRARQAGRPGADDRHALSRALAGRLRPDPALGKAALDDAGVLDLFDGHCLLMGERVHEPSHGAGHTRPVNSGKLLVRSSRFSASSQSPRYTRLFLGDQVVDGAAGRHAAQQRAGVAEGDAAAHAAGGLRAQLLLRQRQVHLKIGPASARWAAGPAPLAAIFHESGWLAHMLPPVNPPPNSPTRAAALLSSERSHDCGLAAQPGAAHVLHRGQHPLVVARHHLDELRRQRIPARQHVPPACGSRSRPRGARSCAPLPLPLPAPCAPGPPCHGCCSGPQSRPPLSPASSSTYAMPPDMPAPKLRPVRPSTTTRPPVMYSQPWSPMASTTAWTPLLRTQKRSPAIPPM